MNNFNHQYSQYANRELCWLPMDTQELYEKNLTTNIDQLEKYGWVNNSFTYKFNRHGFRCSEFDFKSGVMFLGCSFVCGIGLPLESTWAYLVAKNLELPMYNLGIGGTSIDTAFRLAEHYIPILKPCKVILLKPSIDRLEIISHNNHFIDLAPFNSTMLEEFYKFWCTNNLNAKYNRQKNELAIELLCFKNNSRFYSYSIDDMPHRDKARDLAHPGVNTHKEFARMVLEKMA